MLQISIEGFNLKTTEDIKIKNNGPETKWKSHGSSDDVAHPWCWMLSFYTWGDETITRKFSALKKGRVNVILVHKKQRCICTVINYKTPSIQAEIRIILQVNIN